MTCECECEAVACQFSCNFSILATSCSPRGGAWVKKNSGANNSFSLAREAWNYCLDPFVCIILVCTYGCIIPRSTQPPGRKVFFEHLSPNAIINFVLQNNQYSFQDDSPRSIIGMYPPLHLWTAPQLHVLHDGCISRRIFSLCLDPGKAWWWQGDHFRENLEG